MNLRHKAVRTGITDWVKAALFVFFVLPPRSEMLSY